MRAPSDVANRGGATLRIAIIGEGQTEYYCMPKIVGRCGHIVVGKAWIRQVSPNFDWERLFELRVVPLVMAMLTKHPEKIVVILDREDRPECPGDLANRAIAVIRANCGHCLMACAIVVVISDKNFECVLFADYEAVDALPILREKISARFPPHTDGAGVLGWIRHVLKPGCAYHKLRDGMFLAQRLRVDQTAVRARNRSLRKLVHELA